MLLIFPPVAKPSEPPAGIARLAGFLNAHGVRCHCLDMNLEGLFFLLEQPLSAADTWSRRAIKNISKNVAALKNPDTYRSRDRYRRAVRDLGRVLEISGTERSIIAGLAGYQDAGLSPVRSADLIQAAARPEKNLFYPYFKKRLPEIIEQIFFSQGRLRSWSRAGFEPKENPENGPEDQRKMLFVGFSLNYLSQALCTFSMIGFIKKEFPAVKIVLGGGLVTSWMKRPGWKNPLGNLVDHLVSGPGEHPLLRLLRKEEGNQAHATPDYQSLPLKKYLSPGLILPYSASTGCYWNKCSFCPENAEANPYQPVDAARALTDVQALAEATSPVLIHFLDNAISPALLDRLADKPPGVPWYGFARVNKQLAEIDYCIALKRSGCLMLKLGLESGDQGVLDRMRKGIELATASRVLTNLKRAGIAAYVYLLFGTPSETIAEARKTAEFVVRHGDAVAFLNLAIFNMPVCSTEAAGYETEQFYEGDLSLYTGFRHPNGWNRKQVRLFLENEFKRHKTIASILKNEPPVFTSNHAAFFGHLQHE